MPNSPFDREIFNAREKLLSGDFNLSQTTSDLALRSLIDSVFSGRSLQGLSQSRESVFEARFFADSFKVKASLFEAMGVFVSSGIGFSKTTGDSVVDIDGISGLNDESRIKPFVLNESQSFTVPINGSVSTRVDIIEVAYSRLVGDSQLRSVLNQTTGGFESSAINKNLGWALDGLTGIVVAPSTSTEPLSYKQGIPGAGLPATTTGYVKIAEIYVAPGTVNIEGSNIADTRKQMVANNTAVVSAQISLPNVNSTSGFTNIYKPEVISFSGPPGIEFCCYPTGPNKVYNFVLTGNFVNAMASVSALGNFPSSVLDTGSLAAGVRLRSCGVGQALALATDMADPSIADPVVKIPGEQVCAIIQFSPYQIFIDGALVRYQNRIASSGADPLLVNIVAVLSY